MVGPPTVMRELLRVVRPPHPFLVVTQGWPSVLVTILGMGFSLRGAFFPPRFHQYFKNPLNKSGIKLFYTNIQFPPVFNRKSFITLVAGSPVFVEKTLAALHNTKRVLVNVEMDRFRSALVLKKEWKRGLQVLQRFGLRTFSLTDSKCGGATDAQFFFGLGSGPGFGVLPSEANTIKRSLRHLLDGGTEIRTTTPVADLADLALLDPPPRKVIWSPDKKFIRQEGLLPSRHPQVLVACPSYYHPKGLVLRPLALAEALRLYRIPLHIEAVMTKKFNAAMFDSSQAPRMFGPDVWSSKASDRNGQASKDWSFRDCANPSLYSSIFTHLWGVCGGGKVGGPREVEGYTSKEELGNAEEVERDAAKEEVDAESFSSTTSSFGFLPSGRI